LLPGKDSRPLLRDLTEEEMLPFITEHLGVRLPFYEQSKHIINGHSVDVEALANMLRHQGA
jgi:shikimate kinase